MASAEPLFDASKDAWFDLDFKDQQVALTRRDFIRQGDAASWLTSEAFDQKGAGSLETEQALEKAAHAMAAPNFSKQDALVLHTELRKVLSDTDPFWARWRYVGEKKGWL
tara:strand:+ start:25 stop:354 length:330 start_codon:yes stop_codon:yes gene_type:complete